MGRSIRAIADSRQTTQIHRIKHGQTDINDGITISSLMNHL
jgi:hypothetical protein